MNLSPEQRDALQRLLADELRAAWGAALARGATPEALAALAAEHRRALERSLDTGEELYGCGNDPADRPMGNKPR